MLTFKLFSMKLAISWLPTWWGFFLRGILCQVWKLSKRKGRLTFKQGLPLSTWSLLRKYVLFLVHHFYIYVQNVLIASLFYICFYIVRESSFHLSYKCPASSPRPLICMTYNHDVVGKATHTSLLFAQNETLVFYIACCLLIYNLIDIFMKLLSTTMYILLYQAITLCNIKENC